MSEDRRPICVVPGAASLVLITQLPYAGRVSRAAVADSPFLELLQASLKNAMPNAELCLICRVEARLCALPVAQVAATMRPLPVIPIAGVPPSVRGVAIIEGSPVPVVDLAYLLASTESRATRFVTVKTGERRVALAVDEVVGVRTVGSDALRQLPSLLDGHTEAIAAIGTRDRELLVVLRSARLVPESVWSTLAGGVSE